VKRSREVRKGKNFLEEKWVISVSYVCYGMLHRIEGEVCQRRDCHLCDKKAAESEGILTQQKF